MRTVRARVTAGRLIVEATDLPDGTEVDVYLDDSTALGPDDAADIERSIDQGLLEAASGQVHDARAVLTQLRRT
jgi:hypothetical protein